jgi:HEAT repeat protein
VTVPSAHPSATEQELPATPFPIALVEELLRALIKGIRAHQLYLHNNPSYLRSIDAVRAAFGRVWAETEELVLEVTDVELRWESRAVMHEPEKASDSLPWILYKDGVRELRISRGFEQEELVPLLDIIQRVRLSLPDEDDLLTLLWEREFAHLRYRYIDVGTDSSPPLERHDVDDEVLAEDRQQEVQPMDVTMPGVVNLEDYAGSLYFLDDHEVAYLQDEVRKEYETDLRRNVVSILLDTFEQQAAPEVRSEISAVLEGLLLQFLIAGEFRAVAYLLRESAVTAERGRAIRPEERAALLDLPNRLSAPEVLSQVLQALDENPELPAQEDLNTLFEQLRVGALSTVFSGVRRLQSPRLRTLLENAAERLAASHTAELVRLILDDDRDVSREAIHRAGSLRTTAAVPALSRKLNDPSVDVRLATVQALGQIASPGSLQLLDRTIDDAHRDVRVATARALSARAHRSALPKLESAVRGKALRNADLTEKMAFFEAYGAVCGDAGVPLLDSLLNERSLLGRREDTEYRACAAMALGRIASPAAHAALQRSTQEKDVLVRNAVNRALRGNA